MLGLSREEKTLSDSDHAVSEPRPFGGETLSISAATGAGAKRGFAAMDPKRLQEIASKGGRAAHAQGRAHQFSSEEAREAGSRGGRAVSQDRAHMADIGRAGGKARSRALDARDEEQAVVISPAAGEVDPPDQR
jgi:general stress protein YciG